MNNPLGKLLLVVDDDEDITRAVSENLREDGYKVIIARNGQEALSILATGVQPDAIVLDVMMPIMDGLTFLKRREQSAWAKTPVVIMTASGSKDVLRIDNVETVVFKPVRLDVLLGALRRVTHREPLEAQ